MSDTKRLYFLGIDLSTQSCKGLVIDESLKTCYSAYVNFDKDFPQYNTTNGYIDYGEGRIVSPTLMWVEAVDLLFQRLVDCGTPMEDICAISVSGQQHGSVYWREGAETVLKSLHSDLSLRDQLMSCFSIPESPIWMDTSTGAECKELEERIGGPLALAKLTGSRAYERFTGNVIAKMARTFPAEYSATERISLVSSFVTSLLIGEYAPIDYSDGSGMNLLDLTTKKWSADCLMAQHAERERAQLGEPAPSFAIAGSIHPYWAKFGLRPTCRVVNGSGDNPCSLVGLLLRCEGDLAVSLGTSNTVFGLSRHIEPSAEGHVFVSPLDGEERMVLLCFMNGDIVRAAYCREYCGGDWQAFSAALQTTPAGNHGKLLLCYHQPEITPHLRVTGEFCDPPSFSPAERCRGVIEGQFLSMRLHLQQLQFAGRRIVATGGTSGNTAILQVLSDVFQLPVYTLSNKDSAGTGAAIRSYHGWKCREMQHYVPLEEILADVQVPCELCCRPNEATKSVYEEMLERVKVMEQKLQELQ